MLTLALLLGLRFTIPSKILAQSLVSLRILAFILDKIPLATTLYTADPVVHMNSFFTD